VGFVFVISIHAFSNEYVAMIALFLADNDFGVEIDYPPTAS
jgi:hypothetical protein